MPDRVRAERLKVLIQQARKTADGVQRSFTKAEEQLTALEDRDQRRSERQGQPR